MIETKQNTMNASDPSKQTIDHVVEGKKAWVRAHVFIRRQPARASLGLFQAKNGYTLRNEPMDQEAVTAIAAYYSPALILLSRTTRAQRSTSLARNLPNSSGEDATTVSGKRRILERDRAMTWVGEGKLRFAGGAPTINARDFARASRSTWCRD